MKLNKYSHLFLWLFFSGLLLAAIVGATLLGYWQKIPELDRTYISFGIILVFIIGWIFSLIDIIWITKFVSNGKSQRPADFETMIAKKEERSGFFSRLLVSLGFAGTLVGLLFVTISLGSLISAEQEIESIRTNVQGALGGMSAAFLTTIIGLGGSIFIELFHLIFKNIYFNLLSGWEKQK